MGIANPVWTLLLLTLVFGFVFNFTAWGRYLYAIGGNENAARMTGVPSTASSSRPTWSRA
jgi:ribose transport system permease protein